MNTNFIAGAMFIAFIVFITIKGKLAAYMGLIGIGMESRQWQSSP